NTMPLVIEVAAALIRDRDGRYLITQRRHGSHLAGLWEFPGGKLEAGESAEGALRRELTEELGATLSVGKLAEAVRWEYPDRTVVQHFYDCRVEAGVSEWRGGPALGWVGPGGCVADGFPPPDR